MPVFAPDGKLHGKNGAIYINGVKVSNKTEWTLDMKRDYADISTYRDANKVYAAGLMDIQGSFSGLLDVDGDLLVNSNTGTSVTLELYAQAPDPPDPGSRVGGGPAFVDASVSVSNADAIRCTGNFRAAGSWTID